MSIRKRNSDHYDERAGGVAPSVIVLHYTEIDDAGRVDDIFMGKEIVDGVGRVSAHYVIDQAGAIMQYVDENKRAWHAGKSYWNGITDLNSHSVGIELVHAGHKADELSYPDAQIRVLIELCMDIVERYEIKPWNIVGHSDIAPSRKVDPGEFFPWATLAAAGLGCYPLVRDEQSDGALHELLISYGYDPEAPKEDVIKAFASHFAGGNGELGALSLIASELVKLKNSN